MENDALSPETAQKILDARQVAGRPYTDRLVETPNFAHLFREQAAKRGDTPFLIFRDGDRRQSFSYTQFHEKCARLANFLRYKLGIEPGERVSSVAYNHPDTVALAFACWMVGAVYVPANTGEDDERIRFVQENAECRAVFVMPDLVERYGPIREALKTAENVYFILMGEAAGTPEGYLDLATALEKQPETFEDLDLANHETEALIVYTSGTTGTPKGVVLEQYNLLADVHAISQWYGFNNATRMMLVLPIHHVNGLLLTLLAPVYFGGSTVLNRKFSASGYWKAVEEEECTVGSVVPTILSFLLETGEDISRRKLGDYFLICGAGPLTVEVGKRFEEHFGVLVNHGYGLSETSVYSCYLPFDLSREEHNRWMRDYGYPAIGVPLPCNEMDIHTPEGQPVKEGEKGEIVIRGHNVMKGYFKRPEANAETFAHGWFRSGDEGFYKLDDAGRKFFFITGRLKELIIRGGVNYSPLEIDEVINQIPGVKAGMAVGFENDFYGEEVGAYVVREPGASLTEADILAACSGLSYEKQPKAVVFGEEFPITSTGKYQRNKLKPLFGEWKAVQFRKG